MVVAVTQPCCTPDYKTTHYSTLKWLSCFVVKCYFLFKVTLSKWCLSVVLIVRRISIVLYLVVSARQPMELYAVSPCIRPCRILVFNCCSCGHWSVPNAVVYRQPFIEDMWNLKLSRELNGHFSQYTYVNLIDIGFGAAIGMGSVFVPYGFRWLFFGSAFECIAFAFISIVMRRHNTNRRCHSAVML